MRKRHLYMVVKHLLNASLLLICVFWLKIDKSLFWQYNCCKIILFLQRTMHKMLYLCHYSKILVVHSRISSYFANRYVWCSARFIQEGYIYIFWCSIFWCVFLGKTKHLSCIFFIKNYILIIVRFIFFFFYFCYT